MRLIGAGFVLLVLYLITQGVYVVATGGRTAPSPLGIVWTAMTFLAMLALATGKTRTGIALDNPVLITEGRVTRIDALLAGWPAVEVAATRCHLARSAAVGQSPAGWDTRSNAVSWLRIGSG